MSPDLLQRPDSDEDQSPEQKPYDNEFWNMLKRGQLGEDPEALKASEQTGVGPVGDEGADSELSGLDNGGLWNDKSEPGGDKRGLRKRIVGKITGRRALIGGGVAGIIISAAIGLFSIFQGPLQIVHLAQLLQRFHFSNNEDFSDSRTSKLLIYLATLDDPSRRNLGVVGNKAADRYRRFLNESGIELNFENTNRNGRQARRIQSFTIDSNTDGGQRILENLRTNGVSLEDLGGGKFRVSARGSGGTKMSRGIIKAAVDTLDLNKVSGALAKRLLIRRAGVDLHPLKNKAYESTQERADYNREVLDEAAERDKEGVETPDARAQSSQEDVDGDGEPDTDPELDAEVGNANNELEGIRDVDGPEARSRLRGLLRGGGLATAGVAIICTARSLGDEAEAIEHRNIVLPLIRFGTRMVSTGNQVMAGSGLNIDELGAITSALHDEASGSWTSARSIQAELGQDLTGPDIPGEARPSEVGEKPEIFQILDNGVFDAACTIDGIIGDLPGLRQLGELSNGAINSVLGTFGWSIEEFMEGIAGLMVGEEVDTAHAQGAVLGNYANYGARLAANDSAISMGGRELAGTETATLDALQAEELEREFSERNFFARTFNAYSPDTLVGKAIMSSPGSPDSALSSIAKAPLTLFSMLFKPAYAQSSSYDYGFPEYGFSLGEQEDERLEDPMENADLIEPKLAELTQRYEGCFNTTVSYIDGSITSGDAVRYDEIANDPDCSNPGTTFPDGTTELLRYRMYLADMVTAHSLACYEGAEDSCRQLGFDSTVQAGGQTSDTSQIVGDPYESSENIPCAPSTIDLGIREGHHEGAPLRLRLCAIPNLPSNSAESSSGSDFYVEGANGMAIVNSRMSGATFAMIEAAKSAGINLRAESTFRTYEHQRSLFFQLGQDTRRVARPGYSSHEAGTAIDFDNMGDKGGSTADCSNRGRADGNPGWEWLFTNAERYGYKQYSYEPWHWDPLDAPNRCTSAQP